MQFSNLKNTEVDVSPLVWKRIDEALNKRRKRRIIFWFLFGIAISSTFLFLLKRNKNIITNSISITHKNEIKSGFTPIIKPNDLIKTEAENAIHGEAWVVNKSKLQSHQILNTEKNSFVSKPAPTNHWYSSAVKLKIHNKIIKSDPVTSVGDKPVLSYDNLISSSKSDSDIEGISFLPIIQSKIPEKIPVENLSEKTKKTEKHRMLTRFSIYANGGISNSSFHNFSDSLSEYSDEIKSIRQTFFEGGIKFDLNIWLTFSIAVSNLSIEQERIGVNLVSKSLNSNTDYRLLTSFGEVIGNTSVMMNAIFGHDTILFPVAFNGGAAMDSIAAIKMKVNEKFKYYSVPVRLAYKMEYKFITPSIGLNGTINYFHSNSITLNDVELPYNYSTNLNSIIFSIGTFGCLNVHLLPRLDATIGLSYERMIDNIKSDQNFRPWVTKTTAGLAFRF